MRNSGALSLGTHRHLRFAGVATLAEFGLGKSCGRDCAGDRLGNYSAMNFAMVAQRLSATFRRFNNINALPPQRVCQSGCRSSTREAKCGISDIPPPLPSRCGRANGFSSFPESRICSNTAANRRKPHEGLVSESYSSHVDDRDEREPAVDGASVLRPVSTHNRRRYAKHHAPNTTSAVHDGGRLSPFPPLAPGTRAPVRRRHAWLPAPGGQCP